MHEGLILWRDIVPSGCTPASAGGGIFVAGPYQHNFSQRRGIQQRLNPNVAGPELPLRLQRLSHISWSSTYRQQLKAEGKSNNTIKMRQSSQILVHPSLPCWRYAMPKLTLSIITNSNSC